MKKEFSKEWKGSAQARKQRKYRANAPHHIKSKFLHASLNKELKEKTGRGSIRVRAGDEVKILRGSFRGTTGTVDSVDTQKARIYVRGAEVLKEDGGRRPYPVAVSNVTITKLADDKRRQK